MERLNVLRKKHETEKIVAKTVDIGEIDRCKKFFSKNVQKSRFLKKFFHTLYKET